MIDQPGAVALRALAAISRVMFSHGPTGSLPPRRRASRTTRIVYPELSRSQVRVWLCSPVRRDPQEPSRPRWPCPAPLCHVRPWALDHGRQMQPSPESFTLADAFERGWHVTGRCDRCSEPRTPDLGEVVRRAGTRPLASLWATQALRCGRCRSPLASLTIYGAPRSVGPRPVMLRLAIGCERMEPDQQHVER
jgi:hypothetical protein